MQHLTNMQLNCYLCSWNQETVMNQCIFLFSLSNSFTSDVNIVLQKCDPLIFGLKSVYSNFHIVNKGIIQSQLLCGTDLANDNNDINNSNG